MTDYIDWNDAFDNTSYTPGAKQLGDVWANAAQQFRASLTTTAELDLPYGDDERQRLDLFYPTEKPAGLVVFVHGGYWQLFDKSYWSQLAAGALARGWTVALPSYPLAPQATLPDISANIATAITLAAARVDGEIRLAGHSAGGHLVSRMMCQKSPLSSAIQARLAHVVSISGLHDLRPLLNTDMNNQLKLTPETALAESAALQAPIDCPFTAWVGANERPEFLRQNRLIAEKWGQQATSIGSHYDASKHHFNVIDALTQADSALVNTLLS